MSLRLSSLAASLIAAALLPAHAATVSDNFNAPGFQLTGPSHSWTSAGVNFDGFFADKYLRLDGSDTATLTFTLAAGFTYDLGFTFDYYAARNNSGTAATVTFDHVGFGNLDSDGIARTAPTNALNLALVGLFIGQVANPPGIGSQTFNSGTYSSLAAGTYSIGFSMPNTQGARLAVDNLSIQYTATALPVPEPETYAMLLAGLGAIGFVSRRRRVT